MSDERRLEEQFLSQEAERRLTDQLDKVEKIDIDIQTDLGKIVQGKVDGVGFAGKGLVIQDNIRVHDIRLQTDAISINPLSAILGEIKLNQPVNATVRVLITEADANNTLKSEFVLSRMGGFDLVVDDKIVNVKPEKIQMALPSPGKVEFKGRVLLTQSGHTQPLGFTAMICPRDFSPKMKLESFSCTEGDGISVEVILALLQKAKEFLSLTDFDFEDMTLRILNIEVQKDYFILLAQAQVRQVPEGMKLEM